MKTGIVVAMEKELLPLLELCGEYSETQLMGFRVFSFVKYPDITAILSEVGEVRAAIATTLLIEVYKVEYVVNYGYVGSYCSDLMLGELVNITSVVHCDVDLTFCGDKPGQYDGLDFVEFPADTTLFEKIGVRNIKLSSSDKFLGKGQELQKIIDTFGKNVSDMEGAGIAVACYKAGISFSMLKCVSNTPDNSYDEYMEFSKHEIKECAEKVFEVICTDI